MNVNAVTPANAVAPFRCFLSWPLHDGGEGHEFDPDRRVFANLADAAEHAETLAGLNPHASVEIVDGTLTRVSH